MHNKIFLFIAYIAFLTPALTVGAADPVADVTALPDSITLYPQVPYVQLELTVAGNDIYWRQTYGPGEAATFSTTDEALTDGQYRFELIASPQYDEEAWELAINDPELKHDLEVLERSETYRQTGRFEVVQGRIVLLTDPDSTADARSK